MWNLQLQSGRTCKSHLQEERQQIAVLLSPQSPFEHSRCFDKDTKGADGAADLLEVLRNSPLETLYFYECSQIPSAAWQKLRGASWTNLGEASFGWCLVLQTWLRCLASLLRHRVFFPMLSRLFLWQHLTTLKGQKCEIDSCKWSDLQKSLARGAATDCRPLSAQSSFGNSRCFGDDTKGADGAADLLEVLRDSPLEKLDFTGCSQIPSTAWQRVPSGAWPELHDARGIPEEELSRIVLGGAACLGRKFLACEVGPCIRFWEDKWAMGRNLIVLGYLSCYVVGFMRTHVKWKSICCHRLPLSSLMGYRLGNPFNLYTKLRWNGWNHCISLPWLSAWLVQSPQKNL